MPAATTTTTSTALAALKETPLFSGFKLGNLNLLHRVVQVSALGEPITRSVMTETTCIYRHQTLACAVTLSPEVFTCPGPG